MDSFITLHCKAQSFTQASLEFKLIANLEIAVAHHELG
jgi:hypothetical protein